MQKIKGIIGFGLFLFIPYILIFYLNNFYSRGSRGSIIIDTNFESIRLYLGLILFSIWLIFSISLFLQSKTTK